VNVSPAHHPDETVLHGTAFDLTALGAGLPGVAVLVHDAPLIVSPRELSTGGPRLRVEA